MLEQLTLRVVGLAVGLEVVTAFVGAGVGLFVGTLLGAGVGGFEGAGVGCVIQKQSII